MTPSITGKAGRSPAGPHRLKTRISPAAQRSAVHRPATGTLGPTYAASGAGPVQRLVRPGRAPRIPTSWSSDGCTGTAGCSVRSTDAHRAAFRTTTDAHRAAFRMTTTAHRATLRTTTVAHQAAFRMTTTAHRAAFRTTTTSHRATLRTTSAAHQAAILTIAANHHPPPIAPRHRGRTAGRSPARRRDLGTHLCCLGGGSGATACSARSS
jgi:hypothetical protein